MLAEQWMSGVCLLMAVGHCLRLTRFSPMRIGLTSLFCALLLLLCAGCSGPWRAMLSMLLGLAPLFAFPGLPHVMKLPAIALCLVGTLLSAGLMRWARMLLLPGWLSTFLGCVSLLLLPRLTPRSMPIPPSVTALIRVGRRKIVLTALTDTGNLLRDPISHLPVILISRKCAARLISLPEEGEIREGMRLLPVRTVAGASLMPILRPDAVTLTQGGRDRPVEALLGLSPEGYSGFQALVPASLLDTPDLSSSQGGSSSWL